MKRKTPLVAAILLTLTLCLNAAPITFKEISMLLRNGEREQFVFGEAEKRKILEPLTKNEETYLKGLGASPALLTALRSPTLLAPPEAVAAYKARQKAAEAAAAQEETAPRAIMVAPPREGRTFHHVTAGVEYARTSAPVGVMQNDAYSMAQLDDAKAKAKAQKKPLGFIMVYSEFFGKRADPLGYGNLASFAHFYRAFGDSLVLVFVQHETELDSIPDAVKRGFASPDEGGFAPNMAVVDSTASEFIVEVPMGGKDSSVEKRDSIFLGAAAKIETWLEKHPDAIGAPPAPKP